MNFSFWYDFLFAFVDCQSHDENTVFWQDFTVTKDDIADITNRISINHHITSRNTAFVVETIFFKYHNVPTFDNINVLRIHPNFLCQVCVGRKVAVFPLDREEVFRLQQVNHQLQVTGIGMTRYAQILCDEFNRSTCFVDKVLNASHNSFFWSAWSGYDIHQITVFDLNIAVTSQSHFLQTIDWLTHTSSFQDNQFMVFEFMHIFWLNNEFFICHAQAFHANSGTDDIFRIKTSQDHTATVFSGRIKNLLDTRKVWRHSRNDNTPFGIGNHVINFCPNFWFTSR